MAARLFTLPMPEGGAEREVYWMVHHNCPQAKALKPALGDSDLDLVQFPVGLVGEGMPSSTPFEVSTTNPCDACGAYLRAWFQWQSPTFVGPRLWTP